MAFGSHFWQRWKKPLISIPFRKKFRHSIFVYIFIYLRIHWLIPRKLGCLQWNFSCVSVKLMPNLPNAQSAPKKINDSKFDIFMCWQMIVLGFSDCTFWYGTLWTHWSSSTNRKRREIISEWTRKRNNNNCTHTKYSSFIMYGSHFFLSRSFLYRLESVLWNCSSTD